MNPHDVQTSIQTLRCIHFLPIPRCPPKIPPHTLPTQLCPISPHPRPQGNALPGLADGLGPDGAAAVGPPGKQIPSELVSGMTNQDDSSVLFSPHLFVVHQNELHLFPSGRLRGTYSKFVFLFTQAHMFHTPLQLLR